MIYHVVMATKIRIFKMATSILYRSVVVTACSNERERNRNFLYKSDNFEIGHKGTPLAKKQRDVMRAQCQLLQQFLR